jgi:small nuclear ribonucleoprotein (snRNP)-like protein
MLASISVKGKEGSTVTVELRDGRRIVGHLDTKDQITILENTTNLDVKIAECAAGIALVSHQDLGDDTVVWRKLVDAAERCKKQMDNIKYKLN